MKLTNPGLGEAEMFPYATEFECGNCHQGFRLEPGDQWDRVSTDSPNSDFAAATCPNPACGLRVCLANDLGLPWARVPTLPASVPREQRERSRRPRTMTVRADEGSEVELPIPDDDEDDDPPAELPDWRQSGQPYESTLRPRAVVAGVERRSTGHGG
jgi:hypothetical protein